MNEPSINPYDLDAIDQAAEERAKVARNAVRLEGEDIKWLMGGKRGRRVMWTLLERAGVFRSSFDSNPSVAAFNEGQRNIGLNYLSLIHTHAPAAYATMVEENRASA